MTINYMGVCNMDVGSTAIDVQLFYSFTSGQEQLLEGYAKSLPAWMMQQINAYASRQDRVLRIAGKLLLEKAWLYNFPKKGSCWQYFNRDSNKKPFLSGVDCSFSTTHSEELAVIAFAKQGCIGIDAECIKPLDTSLYNDWLHPNEQLQVNQSNDTEAAFYACWVKKEAVLKANGSGIRNHLHLIDTTTCPMFFEQRLYYTKPLNELEGYTIYVAADTAIASLLVKEIRL